MFKFQAPRGTRDFLPADMVVRNYVEKIVRTTFELYGFQQIQTPTFERYDLLAARSGEEIRESMFTFASDAGRYALRPELTSPVCRLVATDAFGTLPRPYKLYYFGPCFRYCRPQPGRYREFYQAGIELMGSPDSLADAETISVAVKALKRLGLTQFRLRVGDVGVFRHLLEQFVGREERHQEYHSRVISDIDKLTNTREKCESLAEQSILTPDDQITLSGLVNSIRKLQEEIEYQGDYAIVPDGSIPADRLLASAEATYRALWVTQGILSEERADLLIRVSRLQGAAGDAIPAGRRLLSGTNALAPLEDLAKVCEWLPALGVTDFEVVLGMARNLDFYTGLVFEIDSPLLGIPRQLCGGGRYDRLVEEFGGPTMPATGFAFMFDRLVDAFDKSKVNLGAIDVVLVSPPARRRLALEVADRLRDESPPFRVGIDLVDADIEGQITYGERAGATVTVLVGLDNLGDTRCELRVEGRGPGTIIELSTLPEQLRRLAAERGTR